MANGTLLRNEESIDTWKLDGPIDGSAFLTDALNLWNRRLARLATR
jgi:hypothetical protein